MNRTALLSRTFSIWSVPEGTAYVVKVLTLHQATLAELDSGSAVKRKVEILSRAAAATASGEVIKVGLACPEFSCTDTL